MTAPPVSPPREHQHHHEHPRGLSWSYRRAVASARARRLALRVREMPGRVARAMGMAADAPAEAAVPTAAPAMAPGAFGRQIASAPGVHHQQDSDRCCAHSVATAMETRIVGGQGGAAVTISADEIFAHIPSRDLASAVEAAGFGVSDNLSAKRTAAGKQLIASSDDAMCEMMRSHIDQNVPLASRIKIYSNFASFSGSGVYAASNGEALVADHAVCILGYGATDGGERYWLCKNSFGAGWGDGGNFKVRWKDAQVVPEISVFAITQVTP